jgi:hypothetical protein
LLFCGHFLRCAADVNTKAGRKDGIRSEYNKFLFNFFH